MFWRITTQARRGGCCHKLRHEAFTLLGLLVIIKKKLYALFPWGPKRLQHIITPVIGYISMPHLYSAQFPLPGEHSLPGIAACDNGAGKFKHNHLSHPTGRVLIYTPESRAAMWINCLAEGQKCSGDGEIRTRALSVRVEWILQYTCTTTPPLSYYV